MAILSEEVKGHEILQNRLNQAIVKDRLSHALLFTGPSGVGKKKMAWVLAQNLLCKKSSLACGRCPSCLKIENHQSEDVLLKVIKPFLSLQTFAKAKIVIINEAHRLNMQSVNSLLKIIEEPPQKSFFILVSSSLASLPVTLRSRFQVIRFNPLSLSVMKELSSETEEVLLASQGRLDILEKMKEQSELRTSAFHFL